MIDEDIKYLFSRENHERLLGRAMSDSEYIARDYLLASGKRIRPKLAMMTYSGLGGVNIFPILCGSMAIECFHKASLIHDDIQDDAKERGGNATLHVTHGVPIAINVGDLLIHQAYSLLVRLNPHKDLHLLFRTAQLQSQMAVGQGLELWRRRENITAPADQLLEVFSLKTSSCFANALLIGACCSQHDLSPGLIKSLESFGGNFGICYQILDGLRDNDLPIGAPWKSIAVDYYERAMFSTVGIPGELGKSLAEFLIEKFDILRGLSASRPATHGTDTPQA